METVNIAASSNRETEPEKQPTVDEHPPSQPPVEQQPATTTVDNLKVYVKDMAEKISKRLSARYVPMLIRRRDRVRRTLRTIPERMQRVTNQARLVLELIDDFSEGHYREVPWNTIAIAAGALLYSVNPGDVFPDVIPLVGGIDDAFVIALAMGIIRRDLKAYCEYKGYNPVEYFG